METVTTKDRFSISTISRRVSIFGHLISKITRRMILRALRELIAFMSAKSLMTRTTSMTTCGSVKKALMSLGPQLAMAPIITTPAKKPACTYTKLRKKPCGSGK